MTTTESPVALHDLGVVDLAAAIRETTISPTEVLESLLDRIARVDREVHSWAWLDTERARAEAAAMGEEAKAGKLRGPLHGVPVGIKDVFDAEGMPTIANSLTTDGTLLDTDSTVAARFRAAGAIVLGKTTTVEFAGMGDPPATRNPWNLEHTAGGSSSGSGAAVGARLIPVAIGTQTGGSNLRPAAYCGVVGFKGSYGRIGRTGCIAVSWSLDHPGIIARCVEDLAAVFLAIAGPDPSDPTTIATPPQVPELDPARLSPPRIGIVEGFYKERAEPAMWAALEAAADAYAAAGASVTRLPLPDNFDAMSRANTLIMGPESAVVHSDRYASRLDRFSARHRARMEAMALIPAGYYLQAQRVRRVLADELAKLFDSVNIVLAPVAPGAAPPGLESTGDASLLSPWTFVGFPSAAISAGLDPAGMPLGLQLMGGPQQDHTVLEAVAWCSAITGILPPPPAFP